VRFRLILGCLALAAGLGFQAPAWAQFLEPKGEGPKLGDAAVQLWQAGMVITARNGPCQGLVGTAPVPTDWPEQETKIVEEDFTPPARVSYRMVEGGVKQMVVQIPYLAPGAECRAVVTVEVRRHSQLRPDNTDVFVLPDKREIPRDVRPFLGPSPEIEITSARIKSIAREFKFDEGKAWNNVEAIYDWVRDKVKVKQGHEGGALAALQKGEGDHEDLASLFIALCRACDVPARTVWVKNYCYPEFYLQDDKGEGHWFPCDVAISSGRVFGEMPDHRPILEKGDNFRSPSNRRERKRYLPETLDGAGGRPSVKFVRDLKSQ
jgi:hypothetical protein